jgi:outer membrane protein W
MTRRAIVTAALAAASSAHADGPLAERLYIRAGVARVQPLSNSRELVLSDVRGPASLAVSDGPIAGSGATLEPLTISAVIVGYRLSRRFALETVLGTPLHAKFRATGTLAEMSIAPEALGIETGVPPLGSSLGEADAVPPVLTLVYQPFDLGPLRPYAGAGASVLFAYNARATNPVLSEVSEPHFHIDPAAGLVLQAGIDCRIWRRVVARVDVKYIAFMKAHATVDDIVVRTPALPLFDRAEVGRAMMDLYLDPLIVQIGVGVDL